jgi:hypothetical protein
MTKFPLGALLNGEYCLPCNAEKGLDYNCPGCGESVIVKKGDVKIHHFAHKPGERDCKFYDHPGESEIHKMSKHIIADLLRNKKIKKVVTKCSYRDASDGCNKLNGYSRIDAYGGHMNYPISKTYDHMINYEDGDEVLVEFRVNSQCIVDIVIINDEKIKYVFEIYYTHKTTRNTPEPWFEIDAKHFLENTCFGTELQSAPPLRINTQGSISTMTKLKLTENLWDVYNDPNKLTGTLTEKRHNLKNAKETCLYCVRDNYICPSCKILHECKTISGVPDGWNIPDLLLAIDRVIITKTQCSNCKKELFTGEDEIIEGWEGYYKLRSPLHICGSKKCICLFCWKFNFETIRKKYYLKSLSAV